MRSNVELCGGTSATNASVTEGDGRNDTPDSRRAEQARAALSDTLLLTSASRVEQPVMWQQTITEEKNGRVHSNLLG